MSTLRTFAYLLMMAGIAGSALAQSGDATPVKGGVSAIKNLSAPAYPSLARAARVGGEVELIVRVRPDGTALDVEFVKGHSMLKEAAMQSAIHSDYICPACAESVAEYRVIYDFVLTDGSECYSDPPPAPEVSQPHEEGRLGQNVAPRVRVEAPTMGICFSHVKRVRSLKCGYLWQCKRVTWTDPFPNTIAYSIGRSASQ